MLYLHGEGLQEFPYVAGWHDHLSRVSWLCVPGQRKTGWQLVLTPAIFNCEISWGFEPASNLPVLLFGSMVHLPPQMWTFMPGSTFLTP